MILTAGTKLGPYEILSQQGAGGMGEVFRGRDTRLDRTVAIKVLSGYLSRNPESLARFEREARAISQLQHPHVCTLFDVGRHEEIDYLVMEFIQGEPLSERLRNGALPIELALRYGAQIADALAAAHRIGIVHRDLKPGNIMITKSGLKLLDFGLAKLQKSTQNTPADVSELNTEMAAPLTGEGTVIGTVQYMSPEQLEGREVDARSDIWALGCVLYEMATGKRPFDGKSHASTIAAILHSQPATVTSLRPLAPLSFDHIVNTCLAKDPEERWQSSADVMRELAWVANSPSFIALQAGKKSQKPQLAWILLFCVLIASAALLYFLPSKKKEGTVEKIRFSIEAPPGTTMEVGQSTSPDGRNLVFVANNTDGSALYVRRLDELEARLLQGTWDARFPFWSPDNHTIGFFAEGKLKKIDINGGSPQTITEVEDGRGGTWGAAGIIVYSPGYFSALLAVREKGGKPWSVTDLKAPIESSSHRWPSFFRMGIISFTSQSQRRQPREASSVLLRFLKSGERVLPPAIPGSRTRTQDICCTHGMPRWLRRSST